MPHAQTFNERRDPCPAFLPRDDDRFNERPRRPVLPHRRVWVERAVLDFRRRRVVERAPRLCR
jgi:hypothetical protein